MRWTGYAKPYKPLRSAVIGWFFSSCDWCISTLAVLVSCSLSGPLFAALLLLCFLIVGIHASGISIPLSLLMLWGWSLMRITINKLYLIPKLSFTCCQRKTKWLPDSNKVNLRQVKLLFGPLVIQLVWYILKQLFTSVSVRSSGYLPPPWWIIVNYVLITTCFPWMPCIYFKQVSSCKVTG